MPQVTTITSVLQRIIIYMYVSSLVEKIMQADYCIAENAMQDCLRNLFFMEQKNGQTQKGSSRA